jgi:hypothetical protein
MLTFPDWQLPEKRSKNNHLPLFPSWIAIPATKGIEYAQSED